MNTREIVFPELILIPPHNLSYDDASRKDVLDWRMSDFKSFSKQDAVNYARTAGFIETGMSPNEVGLLYDLLLKKRPQHIVELGRNFGCSTRIFLWYCVVYGGFLESWDLKHWGISPRSLRETFIAQGFLTEDDGKDGYFVSANGKKIAHLKIADTVKTHIENPNRFIDFLLIDTEHGMENALGEYMRWRSWLKGGSIIAFHDSELPAVARSIDICVEVESDFGGRLVSRYKNEHIEGFGIEALEWKG